MIYGENNVAKRPEVRKKISDRKWKGFTFICITCGIEKRVMPSKVAEKKFCSWACRGKYISTELVGEKAMHWKGGKTINKNGYIELSAKDHPSVQQNGYVAEHRLVMEKHIGRYLNKDEIVHHINEDKTDNRIENLLLTNRADHMRIHNPEGFSGKFKKRKI